MTTKTKTRFETEITAHDVKLFKGGRREEGEGRYEVSLDGYPLLMVATYESGCGPQSAAVFKQGPAYLGVIYFRDEGRIQHVEAVGTEGAKALDAAFTALRSGALHFV